MTDELLQKHLDGKTTLGIYPLLPDNTCYFIAGDFDNHNGYKVPLVDVKAYYEACQAHQIPCYVMRSRSGSGYHVYIFFQKPVPAWKARRVAFYLLQQGGVIGADEKISSFDRLFPNQDELAEGKIGNLIALPFQGEAVKNGNTVFLDPATGFTQPYPDQTAVLKEISYSSEADLNQIIKQQDLQQETNAPMAAASTGPQTTSQDEKILECDFIRWCKENQASVSEPLWFAMLSNVARVSPGGYDLCHLFSKGHLKYSYQETEEKIRRALNETGPHTCKYIKENGFDCGKECGVKSPIVLIRKHVNGSSAKETAADVEGLVQIGLPKIIDMLPGAPVSAELVLPKNWVISYQSGLGIITEIETSEEEEPKKIILNVIYIPLVISKRMVDVVDNKETVVLSFYRDGRWNSLEVEKNKIATAGKITDLADYGIPVISTNAISLVKYLADFEKCNIGAIPLGRSSRQLGWQDNYQGFLWGRNYLTAEPQGNEKAELRNNIGFRGTDSGNEQIADAFASQGSYENWVAAINQLFAYPRVMAAVYFSLGTPLLHILDAPNFTVDWAGGTSTGKTTTLRIAASCWGSPNERSQKSVMFSWDASKVWIERTAAILNGLPLILDDTKLAGKGTFKGSANALISDIIYTIAEGRGRGRGSIDGTQHTGTWQTILLSTGEQSAVDFSMDGGTRARVISLWGPPFGQGAYNLASFIREITLTVKNNYGHAGPKLINYILSNREQWPIWKQEYQDLQKQFAQMAVNNPVADRVSEYVAFLATIIPIVHAALPELRRDVKPEEITHPIWEVAIGVTEEADRAIAALQVIYNFAAAHQDSFWDARQQERKQPPGGWLGRWDISEWTFIGLNTRTVETILSDAGFDVAAVIKTWKDRGYLDTDKSGRGKQVKINKVPSYLYCIKKSAIMTVLNFHGIEDI